MPGVFNPPGCATLWNLPAELEDRFEEAWLRWLKEPAWEPFFQGLQAPASQDLLAMLEERGLLSPSFDDFCRQVEGLLGMPAAGPAT